MDGNIPDGYCLCGCGSYVGFWEENDHWSGQVKGQPKRYVSGHHRRMATEEARLQYREAWAAATETPYGYCWCGCGEKTPVARQSHTERGWLAGEPKKFLARHHHRCRVAGDLVKRFWRHVDTSGECWVWIAGRKDSEYGLFYWNADEPKVSAHRASWRLANGPIPSGINVLHKCDNPPCVRPDHLFLGTQLENVADAIAKGRFRGTGFRGPDALTRGQRA